jgi:hypothetical protein
MEVKSIGNILSALELHEPPEKLMHSIGLPVKGDAHA